MSYCPLLFFSFSATALAWGFERAPRKAQHRQVEPTYKHLPGHREQQRKTEEEPDSAFQREYWEPCNSSFREHYSWGCTGG
jgi:hypothetical protein